MSESLQISAPVWTGKGPVRRRVIETQGDRISRVASEPYPLRPDAVVFSDSSLLVPGLHDAHTHLLFGGLQLGNANFSSVTNREAFQGLLIEHLRHREDEPGAWVQGGDLDETKVRITRIDIDRICSDVPVFIWSHDLHSAVVNSAALIRARIDGGINDPEGGRFDRDRSGVLNGVLRETAAHYVRRFIPAPSAIQARKALMRAQELMFSLGITAVSGSARRDEIPHHLDFAISSDQKIRINLWRVSENFRFEDDSFARIDGTRLRYATLKGFADGALGSHTAALREPYEDEPANTGVASVREGPLARWIRSAHSEGYQIALHAIGDLANSVCLDAIEMAGASGRGPEYRPRVEHAQVLRSADIPRFGEMGVIASMQPIHCVADMRFVEPRIGRERTRGAYAWKSLLNRGATLAFGSDWPVESTDPLAGIHAAVTRQDETQGPPGGWQPQERITVEEALRAYTGAAAFAAFWEESLGTIEVGKLADFTVLSKNLFEIPSREIPRVRAVITVVGGEIVFRADEK